MGAFIDWWRRAFAPVPVLEPPERRVCWPKTALPLQVACNVEDFPLVQATVTRLNVDAGFTIFELYSTRLAAPTMFHIHVTRGSYTGSKSGGCPNGDTEVANFGAPGQCVFITLFGDALADIETAVVVLMHELLHALGLCHNDRQRNIMHPNVSDLVQTTPPDWPDLRGRGPDMSPLLIGPPSLTDAQRATLRELYRR